MDYKEEKAMIAECAKSATLVELFGCYDIVDLRGNPIKRVFIR
jgi:hypothetical protein